MKIAIIGAGFTGLTAAYRLLQKGHTVVVFEKAKNPGGLAIGFTKPTWKWTLEEYYHHWFTNDNAVLTLAAEIGHEVIIKRPKTSVYIDNQSYQLDSPLKVLTFPKLSLFERIRMAAVIAALRFDPFWKPLEKVRAATILPKAMGEKAYKSIWEPQLRNKFGEYLHTISLAWFWARIVKRTPSLAYPKMGFLAFANHLAEEVEKMGGEITYSADVEKIEEKNESVSVGKYGTFDKVIVTLPSFVFTKLCPQLPENYKKKLLPLKGLGASTIVLRLREQFLADTTYWLSICETPSPVMAIVEHTNFMDKKFYNNEHLVYIGNYLSADSPNFSKSKEELLKIYDPLLRKINPNYKKHLIDYDLFKVPFAQPIIPINYSKIIPSFTTPLKNVYLANMQQVYPWDRGTNYAVELGNKIAALLQ